MESNMNITYCPDCGSPTTEKFCNLLMGYSMGPAFWCEKCQTGFMVEYVDSFSPAQIRKMIRRLEKEKI